MTDKLKPCPFCNSEHIEMNSHSEDTWFFAQCTDCNADGPEEDTAANAKIAWNQRANNTLPPQSK
ncbi:Lar family restriction alleviation protein [Xenorhabdus bovienii]|uniref:Lar family restriction alleviation protein n=1 Tax=Xenorhabdus bovienii TaxID=40576 RepID=UPI0023B2B94B|nr:Lar family restriction alleviation protein [Xenorhabdus bovienii]MDE9495499.1 Lar family restriction alleviation protein [Xenorhabdus bovienii]MDE9503923.1 Lar family restriction alleviation protein [Xenorhabdus bovienii]